MYQTSQDHLELFFGTVRAVLGGFNNNPTSRKFQSTYKKLVVHTTSIENFNTGNCIPLDNIEILHNSSSDSIKTTNNSTTNHYINSISQKENVKEFDSYINDYDYLYYQNCIHQIFLKKLPFILLGLLYTSYLYLLTVKLV